MNLGERPACGPEEGDRGEFGLIRQHFDRGPPRRATRGIGDDCALLAPLPAGRQYAVSTDLLIEDRHFFPGTDPGALGHKSLAVNLSDLAANGAEPIAFTLAVSLPARDDVGLDSFARGLFALADRFDCELVGGDTTRGPLNLCLTAMGEVPSGAALRRDGARVGDDLWVSGQIGLAALGLAQLQARTQLPEALVSRCITALQRPLPRVELGLVLRERKLARSAIDISDGLLADLGHITERSRVDAEVVLGQLPYLPAGADPQLARQCQLAGGDDYELVFSAAPEKRAEIATLAAELDLALWRIGQIVAGSGEVRLLDADGQSVPVSDKGFDHFGHQEK